MRLEEFKCSYATNPSHVFGALLSTLRWVLNFYWSSDHILVLADKGGTLHDEMIAGEIDSLT
jgi:hypothetical protein